MLRELVQMTLSLLTIHLTCTIMYVGTPAHACSDCDHELDRAPSHDVYTCCRVKLYTSNVQHHASVPQQWHAGTTATTATTAHPGPPGPPVYDSRQRPVSVQLHGHTSGPHDRTLCNLSHVNEVRLNISQVLASEVPHNSVLVKCCSWV